MNKLRELPLDEPIVTGNTKAAIKAAGGGSSDLWTVPASKLYFDPRDNVRPLDQAHVRHLADLMHANGFDKKHPLGCIVKKVDGEDRIHVCFGQHRYYGALLAISEGKDLGDLPVIIEAAKTVNRKALIIAGVTSNDGQRLSPLDLASAVTELVRLDIPKAEIAKQLCVTEQTVRDVLLLASGGPEIHDLVRKDLVSSTLAIQEIRAVGADPALLRLQRGLAQAQESGKTRVSRKDLVKAEKRTDKISPAQAKALLQALLAVRCDRGFARMSVSTQGIVMDVLLDHDDTIPLASVDLTTDPIEHPVHQYNEHGVFTDCEVLAMPKVKGQAIAPAEIRLAQGGEGAWVFSIGYQLGFSGRAGGPSLRSGIISNSRFEALCAAHDEFLEELHKPNLRKAKERGAVIRWLDKLVENERTALFAAASKGAK